MEDRCWKNILTDTKYMCNCYSGISVSFSYQTFVEYYEIRYTSVSLIERFIYI